MRSDAVVFLYISYSGAIVHFSINLPASQNNQCASHALSCDVSETLGFNECARVVLQ